MENLKKGEGYSGNNRNRPGWKYQIDATKPDVYLMSDNLKCFIGRPVVYFVFDVSNRMVVGIHVSLDGPSYLGVVKALINTTSDKVKYCKQFNIDITEDMWPSKHFPSVLLKERGVLNDAKVDHLIKTFGIKVEITPPNRAYWKGAIERHFRITKLKVKPLAGVVSKVKIKGERDYTINPFLTFTDFQKMMIHSVIEHNNQIISG